MIKAIEISLGDEAITVGKQAMFLRGYYTEITQDHSKIEPLGEAVSARYDGELEVTRVLARYAPIPPDVVG